MIPRPGDRPALPLAAAQLLDPVGAAPLPLHQRQEGLDPRPHGRPPMPKEAARTARVSAIVGSRSRVLARATIPVRPERLELTAVAADAPAPHPHGGGRAGAVGAEEPKTVARRQREGDPVDGPGVGLAQVDGTDDGWWHGVSRSRPSRRRSCSAAGPAGRAGWDEAEDGQVSETRRRTAPSPERSRGGGSGRHRATLGPMRVVGGEARGRPLLSPAGAGLRPTTALVRRALFDILGAEVLGATVLDGYAGVGGLGLEALSRGAALVTFVERERVQLQCLRANLERLGFGERATVVAGAVRPWLARQPLQGYDLVLCDPPYAERAPGAAEGPGGGADSVPEVELVLRAIAATLARPPASADGRPGRPAGTGPVVVLEHHRRVELPEQVGTLACTRAARYGTTVLSFFRRAR